MLLLCHSCCWRTCILECSVVFECWCTDWFWLSSDLSTVMDQFDIAAWERFFLSL
ncbi:hypothetical protein KC19_5G089500 [Ceratodon purpureus]|uniref:Uncharacterized protein n=1 Tax=Ceratodon purpureus TaxID=3225 RepID=A0A8T0I1U2_CERPU|nr:hypothetical protein KC19_5G089500 [Ceratodon purpureus]